MPVSDPTLENQTVVGFNIDAFRAIVARRGLFQNNLFMAYFPVPYGMLGRGGEKDFTDTAREMNMWCESTSIPEVFVRTIDIRRQGYGPTEKIATNPEFKDVSLTFMADADARNWGFFREWMMMVSNFNGSRGATATLGQVGAVRTPVYELGYIDDIATNVAISAFSNDGTERLRIILRQAYPIGVSEMKLGWGDKGDVAKFTVLFTMADWYNDNGMNTPN